jgi:hypothetical protein
LLFLVHCDRPFVDPVYEVIWALVKNVRNRSDSDFGGDQKNVCFTSTNGLHRVQASRQLCADIVAKVENRTTLKISRKLIFVLHCCCVAVQRHC